MLKYNNIYTLPFMELSLRQVLLKLFLFFTLATMAFSDTYTLSLKQGWNFVSLKYDNQVLLSTLSNTNITIIRSYQNNVWKVWTNDDTATSETTLSSLEDGFGYWIKTTDDSSLEITNSGTPNNTVINSDSWNMIGAQTVSDVSAFLTQNPNVQILWKYTNGEYLSVSRDSTINSELQAKNISSFTSINASEGFWIKLSNLNPIITSTNTASVYENQTAALSVKAIDNSSLTYAISGIDSSSVNISSTGVVTFKSAPDYESKISYDFSVVVKDTQNNMNTQSISISILDIDENIKPTANAGVSRSVFYREMVTLDASLSSDDESIISYEWKEASTVLSNSSSFTKSDFAVGVHNITLKVTDNGGKTDTSSIIITVQDALSQPDLSTMGTKTYNYTYDGANMFLIASKGANNNLDVSLNESFYDSSIDRTFSVTIDYSLNWNGKGYEGYATKTNWTLINEIIDGIAVDFTYDKVKRYANLNMYDKTISYKIYGLAKMRATYNGETQWFYFKHVNDNDPLQVSSSEYQSLTSNFDTNYANLSVIQDNEMPENIKQSIFNDLESAPKL